MRLERTGGLCACTAATHASSPWGEGGGGLDKYALALSELQEEGQVLAVNIAGVRLFLQASATDGDKQNSDGRAQTPLVKCD